MSVFSYPSTTPPEREALLAEEASPAAGLVCLFGLFIHIIFSGPILETLGMNYLAEGGSLIEKIHPGSFFIYLSFALLLGHKGNPLSQLLTMYRAERIYTSFFMLWMLLITYMFGRDGPGGLAFALDTHITVPVTALVLSFTPLEYCRRATKLFLCVALINSPVGIVEAWGKFRVFPYDASMTIFKETYFRASAFRGHPLANGIFASIALFVALSQRFSLVTKALIALIVVVSLVGFGGRMALLGSLLGLGIVSLLSMKAFFTGPSRSMQRMILGAAMAIAAPICLAVALYFTLNSSYGERIASHGLWDESANARQLALMVLDYMQDDEKLFGVSLARMEDITYRMNLHMPISHMENPWLIMFMRLGIFAFTLWIAGLAFFVWRLVHGTSLALGWAVIDYFLIASTYNSFGVKDSTMLIATGAVICARKSLRLRQEKPPAPVLAYQPRFA